MNTFIFHISEIDLAAEWVLKNARGSKKIALYGGVGAGKTTLTKAICRTLNVQDLAVSPTFAIVNEYENAALGLRIHHLDLYRLRNIEEALDIGVEEWLNDEHYCILEWPELVEPLLPEDVFRIMLEEVDESHRKIVIL
jgi:tRNA threonylcarbamoyladenosine biosynthesis protein TsaE